MADREQMPFRFRYKPTQKRFSYYLSTLGARQNNHTTESANEQVPESTQVRWVPCYNFELFLARGFLKRVNNMPNIILKRIA